MSIQYFLAISCLALLLIGSPADLKAQRQIGIRWDVPQQTEQAIRELEIFHKSGISLLEVNRDLSLPVWEKIDELEFQVYGSLPIRFPLVHTFSSPDSLFLNTIAYLVMHYASHESVQAIGLFQYGQTSGARFAEALEPYVQQIKEAFSGKLYYLAQQAKPVGSDRLFNFKMIRIKADDTPPPHTAGAYFYSPSEELKSFLTPVRNLLEKTSPDSIPLFFDSGWLLRTLKAHPAFQKTINRYTSDPEPFFVMPEETIPAVSSHSLVILLLVIVWGTFAVNYNISPVYRKSLLRYFTGHRFYVEDIMQRHIRSGSPAGIILLQHAVLTGITMYCFVSAVFSPLGIEAISFHLPVSVLGANFVASIALGAFVIGLLIEGICLLWLLLANRRIKQIAQAVNLYMGPLQLNLIVTTIMVTLLVAGDYAIFIYILGIVFLLIFLSAFIITSFDTARHAKNKYLFLTVTSFIYIAIWAGLFIWILNNSYLMDIYDLALGLS